MSIILKGIDLPTDRKPYGIEVIYRFEGADGLFSEQNYLSPNEAIQIPKNHGRLIDADELKEKRETMCWKDDCYMTHESDFIDSRHIDNAPTILEAEE